MKKPVISERADRSFMRLTFFLLFLVMLAGCAPKAAFIPEPLPADIEKNLLARLQESGDYFQSLKGLAKVQVSTPDRSLRVNQAVLVERPHNLRTEVMGLFGQTYMILASNKEQLSVYLPQSGDFYEGKPTSENLLKFMRLPFEVDDLVRILLYQVPVVNPLYTEVSYTREGNYQLNLHAESQYRQVAVFSPDLRLLSSAYFREKEKLLYISYADFDNGTPAFPRQIAVEISAGQTQAQLNFSEFATNVAIPSERFHLQVPQGVTISPLP